ncbi:MAG: hypothetical protein Q8K78_05300, partial [Planctomycetaceae bacterium]|nr:hypothetical protein [Planctomycetaceae bacterium]
MLPSDDVLAGLPAPLDDEPPSVRQDIADELADHLACAYRRELLKTADEPTAQQRVLDRFGDPRRIAYQLWFQALWGRIMLNRFAKVVQGLKIVGGLVALFLIVRMAEQQTSLQNQIVFMTSSYNSMQSQAMGTRNLLEQVLSRLPQPPQQSGYPGDMGAAGGMMPGEGAMMGMGSAAMGPGAMGGSMGGTPMEMGGFSEDPNAVHPGLTVRLTMQGTKDEAVTGCMVALISEQGKPLDMLRPTSDAEGMSMGAMPSIISVDSYASGQGLSMRQTSTGGHTLTPEMRGICRFVQKLPNQTLGSVEPGRYTLYVEFHDGRQAQRLIVIPPSAKAVNQTEHIVCPAPSQNAYVVIHTPIVPQDLIDAGLSVVASVKRKPTTIEGTEWQTGNSADDLFLDFDPKTGAPTQYDRNSGNYSSFSKYFAHGSDRGLYKGTKFGNLATADRFLKLPSGNYEVVLGWWDRREDRLIHRVPTKEDEEAGRIGILYGYEGFTAGDNGVLVISPDTRDVLLDFPEGMLDVAQNVLTERTSTTQTTPADPKMTDGNPPPSPTSTTPESEPAKP